VLTGGQHRVRRDDVEALLDPGRRALIARPPIHQYPDLPETRDYRERYLALEAEAGLAE
jgi:hypothetical protein